MRCGARRARGGRGRRSSRAGGRCRPPAAGRGSRTRAGRDGRARGRGSFRRAASQRSETAPASPISIRAPDFAARAANARIRRRTERRSCRDDRGPSARRPRRRARRSVPAGARDVLEKDPLDGAARAEAEDLLGRRLDQTFAHGRNSKRVASGELARAVRASVAINPRLPRMPIHVRANPGDYAEACLLPGDPLRAKYIAETFLTMSSSATASVGCSGSPARSTASPCPSSRAGWGARRRRS